MEISVVCTDSSGFGRGVCDRSLPVEQVASIAAWRERWRFRKLPPDEWGPRARAMGELDELTDPRTVRGDLPEEDQEWVHVEGVPEVTLDVLVAARWRTVCVDPSLYNEHNTVRGRRAYL